MSSGERDAILHAWANAHAPCGHVQARLVLELLEEAEWLREQLRECNYATNQEGVAKESGPAH